MHRNLFTCVGNIILTESSILIKPASAPMFQLQYKGSRHVSHTERNNKDEDFFQSLIFRVYGSHDPAEGKAYHDQDPARYPPGTR